MSIEFPIHISHMPKVIRIPDCANEKSLLPFLMVYFIKTQEVIVFLRFLVLVNGKDLSRATHEEAVEAFRNAKEPIVVQVLRRTPLSKPAYLTTPDVQLMNASTQTDITFEHIMALAKLRPPTPPVPDICPFLLSDSCHSLHPMEHEFYEDHEYLSSLPADADRTEDFEYELSLADTGKDIVVWTGASLPALVDQSSSDAANILLVSAPNTLGVSNTL
ncbi:PDZ domain-containing RING finger protein 4 [Galemys pyrenaicus]|uniref:PDZ domain-containing RING finger protein 4 n=1 Tax=Galemys pyrenaicus TaxID=202257 RepID=A0A8J6AM13_GALPY|nr:PDZ domain-containing RING finger protein 4 [Galemys pyrenaicus]